MLVGVYAQKPTMELTFTADNNGQHVPLTSILIENLTQGGDTTLYAPDTMLSISYQLGIEDHESNAFSLSQNFPNPFVGQTSISIYLLERDHVRLRVLNLLGNEVAFLEQTLGSGYHTFSFHSGNERMYVLTAACGSGTKTIRMMGINVPASGRCVIEYNGMDRETTYKSYQGKSGFKFNLGDQLHYTASSALGEWTIIDTPTGNQTYTFQYGSGGAPCPGMPTVTDIDGNVYNTVLIGAQCWMKENLKTTTYRTGTAIPNVTDDNAWSNLSTGAYVWHDNDISRKDKYGALYNWFTTVDPNGLCPTGWHVPTNDEWNNLTDYIGGTGSPHGNELKSCRQVNSPLGGGCNTSEHPRWKFCNSSYGTDDYGFSGLPGGTRNDVGHFFFIGESGEWWSSNDGGTSEYAWFRALNHLWGYVNVYSDYKLDGRSVRCLRD